MISPILVRHAPKILAAVGAAGVISTAVLAAHGHLEARETRYELGETRGECIFNAFKARWRHYVPAAISGAVTITAIFSGSLLSARQTASLAAALAATQNQYKSIKGAVDLLPEETREEVRNKAAQITAATSDDRSKIVVPDGDVLFCDAFTGRYFAASPSDVDAAVNFVNHELNCGDSVSLNQYYEYLDLPPTSSGDILGWPIMTQLEIDKTASIAKNGAPCVVVDFQTPPRPNFYKVIG